MAVGTGERGSVWGLRRGSSVAAGLVKMIMAMAVSVKNTTKATQTSREREKGWGRFQLETFYLIHSIVEL